MAKLSAVMTFLAIASRTVFSQSCPFSFLRFTPNETEYFPGDLVNATCFQFCDTLPLFCQPSLFYGTSERWIFPETVEKRTHINKCSYYRFTLFNVDAIDLAGHNISCGGQLRNGSYRLSVPPVTISVKPIELHTANCTTDGTLRVTCTHPAVPSNVSLVVNGDVQDSKESSTGVTYFSLPYPGSTNVSGSCHAIRNSAFHNSVSVIIQPVGTCSSSFLSGAKSQLLWIIIPVVLSLVIAILCSISMACVLRARRKLNTTDTQSKDASSENTGVQGYSFRVSEENVVSTECNDEAHHSPIKMELKPSIANAALAEVHMTEIHTDANIEGHNDAEYGTIAMDVNPSYVALNEVQMLDSNIIDGRNIADYDSPITMAVNPSYMTLTEVEMADSNDGNDETGHDGPGAITMEANPSYMSLAEVYTQDSSLSAANVHLQQNPSYVALPMTVSQGQDFLVCASPSVSRSTAACTLSQRRALPLPDQHPP